MNFNLVDQKNSHNCIIIVKGVKFIQIDSNLIKTLNSKKWPKPKKSSLHIKMHPKIHLRGFSAPSQSKWEKTVFGYRHRNSIDSGNMMHVSTRSVHLFMFFHSFCMRFVMPNENLACNRDYDAIKCRLFVVKRANAMELHRPTATMQKITAIFAYNVCVNSLYFSIYVLLGSIGYVLCVRWAWRRHGSWNHRSQLTVIERKIGVCSNFSKRSTFDDWLNDWRHLWFSFVFPPAKSYLQLLTCVPKWLANTKWWIDEVRYARQRFRYPLNFSHPTAWSRLWIERVQRSTNIGFINSI